ncbi:MAG: tyrosinase family protein [Candidatus Electrothrix sp. GM3_4]|nr:tyrosinase family protein [Candidatus Electrothrix sp. GM3_4]
MSRIRKNIDSLSDAELSDFEYAVLKVKQISEDDPESKDGYDYFAALHNDIDVGPCEHGRETFLPWHRAHLWEFENALRRSDPPRTSNVTIPYWDWSQMPSGNRFPEIFEDTSSPLYAVGRNPSSVGNKVPFPWSLLKNDVLSVSKWSGNDSFGGAKEIEESNCGTHGRGGYGELEDPAHNSMHFTYIGGAMGNPESAAEDPIFWVFHAFIDLLWWKWQQQPGHSVDTGFNFRLCGLVRNSATGERWVVKDTVATDLPPLGYSYEFTEPALIPISPLHHPAAEMIAEAARPVVQLKTMDFNIPNTEPGRSMLSLEGIANLNQNSFDLLVFLTPQGQAVNPRSPAFVQEHLVELLSIWQVHFQHAHHNSEHATMDRRVDLTDALKELSKNHSGEIWTVSVAAVADERIAVLETGAHNEASAKVSAFNDDTQPVFDAVDNIGFTKMRLEIEEDQDDKQSSTCV